MPRPLPARTLACLLLVVSSSVAAAEPAAKLANRKTESRPARKASTWFVKETANFRVYSLAGQTHVDRLGARCEQLREQLAGVWLGQRPCAAWTKRCDVIVYPNLASYLNAVGREAEQTAGSALIEMNGREVSTRRIDLRGDLGSEMQSALAHELTHVIVCDRLDRSLLPAWADEGMAVLADNPEKQQAHLADFRDGLRARRAFRTAELVSLAGYPDPERVGVFYGQAGSLVSYLVGRGTPERFVKFLEVALEGGYDKALREVYDINGIAQLERLWQQNLRGGEVRFASYVPGGIWQNTVRSAAAEG